MNNHKLEYRLLVILLVALITLSGCKTPLRAAPSDPPQEEAPSDPAQEEAPSDPPQEETSPGLAEKLRDTDDLHMTIYFYEDEIPYTYRPISAEEFKQFEDVGKLEVDGAALAEQTELLQLLAEHIETADKTLSYMDCILCYTLTSERDGELLEIVLRGIGGPVFVNGEAFVYDEIFYLAVLPFLPEEIQAIYWK